MMCTQRGRDLGLQEALSQAEGREGSPGEQCFICDLKRELELLREEGTVLQAEGVERPRPLGKAETVERESKRTEVRALLSGTEELVKDEAG